MKKIWILSFLVIFLSCGQDSSAPGEKDNTDALATDLKAETNQQPLAYPALYTDWEIGSRENLNAVLNMYKAWDEVSVSNMTEYFADSVVLDMPDGKRTEGSKEEVIAKMGNFRKNYTNTSNQVLNAISLKNKEKNSEWVRVMVYNKWEYKDTKKKDSMLYYDIWKIKDGKIKSLMSFEQTPSRMELKKLEKMANKLSK